MNDEPPDALPFTHPAVLAGTVCGIGFLPVAPGTWGSLAALPIAWVVLGWAGWPVLLMLAVVVFVLGVWAADVYIAANGEEDPSEIVIDEVAAQLAVLAVAPRVLAAFAAGFVLFRIADIVKPFPAGWADRTIKGGLGAMADDVFAAVWAAAGLAILLWIWPL